MSAPQQAPVAAVRRHVEAAYKALETARIAHAAGEPVDRQAIISELRAALRLLGIEPR